MGLDTPTLWDKQHGLIISPALGIAIECLCEGESEGKVQNWLVLVIMDPAPWVPESNSIITCSSSTGWASHSILVIELLSPPPLLLLSMPLSLLSNDKIVFDLEMLPGKWWTNKLPHNGCWPTICPDYNRHMWVLGKESKLRAGNEAGSHKCKRFLPVPAKLSRIAVR